MNMDPRYYGCLNRRDSVASYPVQDGWYMDGHTRTPRMVSQPNFSYGKPCEFTQFQLTPESPANRDDVRCAGCARKQDLTKGAEIDA